MLIHQGQFTGQPSTIEIRPSRTAGYGSAGQWRQSPADDSTPSDLTNRVAMHLQIHSTSST
jgi:hypothetical protein